MENTKPITPQQAKDSLLKKLPDGFLEELNKAIEDNFNGLSSYVRLNSLSGWVKLPTEELSKKATIIQTILREAGWKNIRLEIDKNYLSVDV